jgi:adenylylsulfate kinase-like enzyme
VPKVQHKPIKSPRKGSNKKSKRQLKAALVWRTGLSGAPGRSTPNLSPSGIWEATPL